ncbi:putative RNA polymerase [Bacillus sp. TS-2]|nr:putative RNA polymerase [Bacillus sp. TS-2]
MRKLLIEYKGHYRRLEQYKNRALEHEQKIVSGMLSDLRYSIDWMSSGREPGARRGIERRAVYQRELLMEPAMLQVVSDHCRLNERENCLEEEEREALESKINEILSKLTEREKDIYLMSRVNLLSYQQIASLLSVSKSTIQKTLERAEMKIKIQKDFI